MRSDVLYYNNCVCCHRRGVFSEFQLNTTAIRSTSLLRIINTTSIEEDPPFILVRRSLNYDLRKIEVVIMVT